MPDSFRRNICTYFIIIHIYKRDANCVFNAIHDLSYFSPHKLKKMSHLNQLIAGKYPTLQ